VDRVLVACPNFEPKAYCLHAWVDAYNALTYQRREAFMVDNTPGHLRFLNRIRAAGIPAIHIEPVYEPSELFSHTLELCWRAILARAQENHCTWVASIEADVIVPPATLETLLVLGTGYDVVGHTYPTRGAWQGEQMIALGCTLIRRSWLEKRIDFWTTNPETDIWRGARSREVEGLLRLQHLDPPDGTVG